ncbi:MAG: nuclear transport factor 2 family protein [Candidatus Kariarchaeaceae archaeon]|jgi:ketosteroid isomerase-like protein
MTDKELIRSHFQALNTHDADSIKKVASELLDPNIVMNMFDHISGKYQIVNGLDVVTNILVENFAAPHDNTLIVKEMVQEGNTIYVDMLSKGTNWMVVDKPFEFKHITRIVVENKKIKSIHNFFDSFEFMRLWGQAILVQNDEAKIKEYLSLLVDMGMLPPEY